MKQKLLQWLAIGLIGEIGILHLIAAPQEFGEAEYLGALFVINFLLAFGAALRIYSGERSGWLIGLAVAGGSFSGYILSRTVGLPGMEVEEWLNPLGIISLAVEALFLATFALRQPWRTQNLVSDSSLSQRPALIRYGLPVGTLALVLAISLPAYWINQQTPPQHTANVTHISPSDLEEQYGVRVTSAGVTMLGGVLDVRLKILNAQKARPLLDNPNMMPALMTVNAKPEMVMAARMGHHSSLKDGGVMFLFFPNPSRVLSTGTPISLMFGDLQVDSLEVK